MSPWRHDITVVASTLGWPRPPARAAHAAPTATPSGVWQSAAPHHSERSKARPARPARAKGLTGRHLQVPRRRHLRTRQLGLWCVQQPVPASSALMRGSLFGPMRVYDRNPYPGRRQPYLPACQTILQRRLRRNSSLLSFLLPPRSLTAAAPGAGDPGLRNHGSTSISTPVPRWCFPEYGVRMHLSNMRDHLKALAEIQIALAEGKFDTASAVANNNLACPRSVARRTLWRVTCQLACRRRSGPCTAVPAASRSRRRTAARPVTSNLQCRRWRKSQPPALRVAGYRLR